MAEVVLAGLGKAFGGRFVVRDLDLRIDDGELFVLVGPSGSGKSLVLRMVAGLEQPTTGRVLIGGRSVDAVAVQDRDIAMMFESHALYPHLSVYENLAFGLRHHRIPANEVDERVRDVAHHLGLTELLGWKPERLSGAHRQATALGRAIVRDPRVLLLDEPLSQVDPHLRAEARATIHEVQRSLHLTTLLVTSDQAEAMLMGDRIGVMRAGTLRQVGRPDAVYADPSDLFVGTFLGSPPMNLALGGLERDGADVVLRVGETALGPVERWRPLLDRVGQPVVIGARAADLRLELGVRTPGASLPGTVEDVELVGPELLVRCSVPSPPVRVDEVSPDAVPTVGGADPLERATWTVHAGLRSPIELAASVGVLVDLSRLHLFDPSTGTAIRT